MKFFESITMAISNVFANKFRTFLTTIGIIIGIVAVIVIVGLGNGLEDYIEKSFESLGADTLTVVVSGRGDVSTSFSEDNMYEIMEAHPDYLEYLSPIASLSYSAKIGNETVSTTITGVSEDYFFIKDYYISDGRNISYGDISYRNNVAVIGEYLNQTYYSGNAVGQTLKISGYSFEIVGVMQSEDSSLSEGGTDDAIYIPYSTASRISPMSSYTYNISLVDADLIDESEAVIEEGLLEIFSDEDSYIIVNMSSMIEEMQSMVSVLVLVLAGIAAISLLVGGIGIMNIMLVSVTERTKEIGIRKALGAKERYILRQFIIEAAVTSALGGAVGIAMGVGLCSVASNVVSSMIGTTLTVSPGNTAIMLAFGISSGIGVLFGYLPAKQAAALNPIDALRYD